MLNKIVKRTPTNVAAQCILLVTLILATRAGAAELPAAKLESSTPATATARQLEEKWGIQVSGLFLSAGGNMVDFRYRVINPAKAAILTKAALKPSLIDETSGAKLIVPSSPKVGQLRQTVDRPVAGKIYFMLFENTRHHVKSGDKVIIEVGDFRTDNLVVE